MDRTPRVGYCVDMLDAPYADYLSCNNPPVGTGGPGLPPAGDYAANSPCCCQDAGDRNIANQSMATLQNICNMNPRSAGDPDGESCHCTASALRLSNQSVGRMPLGLWVRADIVISVWSLICGAVLHKRHPSTISREPLQLTPRMVASFCQLKAGLPARPTSWWYSTPRHGECAAGVALGTDGCTWRRRPLAWVAWLRELLPLGFVGRYAGGEPVAHDAWRINLGVLEKMQSNLAARFVAMRDPCGDQ